MYEYIQYIHQVLHFRVHAWALCLLGNAYRKQQNNKTQHYSLVQPITWKRVISEFNYVNPVRREVRLPLLTNTALNRGMPRRYSSRLTLDLSALSFR